MRIKTAIVSGAASGLGKVMCEEFARRGGIAIVTGLTQAEVQATADAIVQAGGKAIALPMDIRKRETDSSGDRYRGRAVRQTRLLF